jgi:hypothetical protein
VYDGIFANNGLSSGSQVSGNLRRKSETPGKRVHHGMEYGSRDERGEKSECRKG